MAGLSKKRASPDPDATDEAPHTPFGSPANKKLKITQRQKQALIQNLQLEITERARNLRAHYGLQVQDLRSRLERRVNRIPIAMRKMTMGELLAKHEESMKQAESAAAATKKPATRATKKSVATKPRSAPASPRKEPPFVMKPVKRKSDEIHSSDKENAPFADDTHPPLTNPKKRSKPNLAGSRAVSQVAASEISESRVLSPKSSNSRTFPQSPLKSPSKAQHEFMSCRPSPLKMNSPLKTRSGANASRKTMAQENVAPGGKTTGTTRKAPSRPPTRTHTRQGSTSTVLSTASNGTTIVRPSRATGARKTTKATSTAGTAAKKAAAPRGQATAASATKKTTTAARKAQAVDQPAPGRRVLRNRG